MGLFTDRPQVKNRQTNPKTVAEQLRFRMFSLFQKIKSDYKITNNMVFNNPNLTPEEIVKELGQDGEEFLDFLKALEQLIEDRAPQDKFTDFKGKKLKKSIGGRIIVE